MNTTNFSFSPTELPKIQVMKKGTKKRSLNLKYKNESIDYNVILAQQPNMHMGRIFEVFFRIVC